MKILHVIPSLSMVHGGPSVAVRSMEAALVARGIHVSIASTDDDGPGRRSAHQLGVGLISGAGSLGTRWYFKKNFDFYKTSWSLALWLWRSSGSYDLVHIHALFSFSTIVAAVAALRSGVPYVVRPLGTLSPYGLGQRRPRLKRWSIKLVEGPLLERAAAVHFTSVLEQTEAEVLGLKLKGVVVPLGIELLDGKAVLPVNEMFPTLQDVPYLLSLSRIDPKKNVEGLLDAFASIHQRFNDLWLVVAGDGEASYVATLMARASNLQIASRVLWTGKVVGDAKLSLLANAHTFVLPSYSENFGIAVVEALSVGVPCVVSSGVALSSDIVLAGAGFACSLEPDNIAECLARILHEPDLRERMASSATALAAARFSQDAMGQSLHKLYQSLCQGDAQN